MAIKQVIRGDSYGTLRPLFVLKFANENASAYSLAGLTIRTTYKTTKTDPATDPTDSTALIKHELIVDETGVVTLSNGLVMVGNATEGIVHEHLTADESMSLPLNVEIFSDVEVTKGDDVITFVYQDSIRAEDGYTNRS